MDQIGALIPIVTDAQADPLLLPNTPSSLRVFKDSTTGLVSTIDAAGNIIPIGGGSGTIQLYRRVVAIPSSQVLQMGTTPVEIIPALPGVTIFPLQAVVAIPVFGTTPYATHGNLFLSFQGATKSIFFLPETDFLFSNSIANCIIPFDTPNANSEMLINDAPLEASIEFGNPTAGDSEIIIAVLYTLL